ncbi:aminoglycoside phosphotransferase family protein [Terrabacter sp. NPDC080008]|uniref:aminoglycoside phosphotransferase family protein n=1 Tax=Terrabacter sp. NPDC080008 TaxID=3155176 RepID=UPI00344E88F9
MSTPTSVSTSAGPPGAPVDLVAVEGILRRHLGPQPARLALVAMSRDDNPKAVVVATPVGGAPALAVKAALTPGAAESVRAEAAALTRLAELDPGLVEGTVPRPIALHDTAAGTFLVTTVATGRPLSVDYHRWHHTGRRRDVRADFAAAAAWLSRLHALAVPSVPEPDTGRLLQARWAGEELGQAAADVCRGARERVGELDATHVAHGDFWFGNVLRTGRRVSGVVDWEHTVFGSSPLWDRVRFALAYTLYLDRHTAGGAPVHGHAGLRAVAWGDPVRHLLRGQGWYADLVSAFIAPGAERELRAVPWRAALLVGLAQVAAGSDEPEFARAHALLLTEVGP